MSINLSQIKRRVEKVDFKKFSEFCEDFSQKAEGGLEEFAKKISLSEQNRENDGMEK